ncbi:hypothetical protein ACWDGI_09670 [Streptomyces sp. NPDC001220]
MKVFQNDGKVLEKAADTFLLRGVELIMGDSPPSDAIAGRNRPS